MRKERCNQHSSLHSEKKPHTALKLHLPSHIFPFPSKTDVEDVIYRARFSVLTSQDIIISKALPPPLGLSVNNAGVR